MNDNKQVIRHSKELGLTIVASPQEYRVDYVIYEIVGWGAVDENGVHHNPLWSKKDSVSFDQVDSLEDATTYLHGYVKWDGCSNWHFDEQDRVMLHGCSREDLQRIGDVLTACWDLAKELVPAWNP